MYLEDCAPQAQKFGIIDIRNIVFLRFSIKSNIKFSKFSAARPIIFLTLRECFYKNVTIFRIVTSLSANFFLTPQFRTMFLFCAQNLAWSTFLERGEFEKTGFNRQEPSPPTEKQVRTQLPVPKQVSSNESIETLRTQHSLRPVTVTY